MRTEHRECGAAAIFLLGAIWVLSSNANALDGVTLYKACQAKKDSSLDMACSAYVHGFLDGSALGYAIGKEAPNLYCPPKEGISVVQGRLIIDAHFKNHPEKLHKEAATIVMDALVDAFNCPTR